MTLFVLKFDELKPYLYSGYPYPKTHITWNWVIKNSNGQLLEDSDLKLNINRMYQNDV